MSASQPSRPPVVMCRDVTKTYGRGNAAVPALRGVDLEVRPGELLMLAGPSGCGKTTLISVLAGLLPRDGGDCTVLNRDYTAMSPEANTGFRGDNIGFVFQAFNLIPTLTAAENAATPLVIAGTGRRAAEAQAGSLLREMDFDARMLRALPPRLSGGQQQRVALARALVHQPRLILCDEPTSALDRASGHQVMTLMRRFAQTGDRTLIVVTHDERIFEFADRIAHMEDGRIAHTEPGARHSTPTSPHHSS